MQVKALDHVNISTLDPAASARWYADLLGLEIRNAPAPMTPDNVQWLYDDGERPIIHLVRRPPATGPTGAIDHVALNCTGHAELVARLQQRGVEFRQADVPSIGLRQVFLHDPHGVKLELNFRGD